MFPNVSYIPSPKLTQHEITIQLPKGGNSIWNRTPFPLAPCTTALLYCTVSTHCEEDGFRFLLLDGREPTCLSSQVGMYGIIPSSSNQLFDAHFLFGGVHPGVPEREVVSTVNWELTTRTHRSTRLVSIRTRIFKCTWTKLKLKRKSKTGKSVWEVDVEIHVLQSGTGWTLPEVVDQLKRLFDGWLTVETIFLFFFA